jgi:hypothetical protein
MNRESHILREKHGSAGGQIIIANCNPEIAMMSMMRDANERAAWPLGYFVEASNTKCNSGHLNLALLGVISAILTSFAVLAARGRWSSESGTILRPGNARAPLFLGRRLCCED